MALGRIIAPRTGEITSGTLNDGDHEFYLADHLGSTSTTITSAGDVQAVRQYWPFGASRSASGSALPEQAYTGQREETHSHLGLYYYHARFYSTELAHFVSADPVSVQSTFRYSYAANNPIIYSDPSGLCFQHWDGSVPECTVESARAWFACAMGGCGGQLEAYAQLGIGQEMFWDNVSTLSEDHRNLVPYLIDTIVSGPINHERFSVVTGYGWATLGAYFGVSERFFRLSLYDLMNGTFNIANHVTGRDIVGAYDWWNDWDILGGVWSEYLKNKMPYNKQALGQIAPASIREIRQMLREGVDVNKILGWSWVQLHILIQESKDFPQHRRFDSDAYTTTLIECVSSGGANCNGHIRDLAKAAEWAARILRKIRS